MTLCSMIKEIREERRFRRFQRMNRWEGLVPGDVVRYKGRDYLYVGFNPYGGPGMPGIREPRFTYADPKQGDTTFYLRSAEFFPNEVFRENAPAIGWMDADLTPLMTGQKKEVPLYNRGSIAFLNATREQLQKVRHYTPQEWDDIVENTRRQLGGSLSRTV